MNALNISSFIWGIADDVLRDHYVRGKYRDVILPMTVIRRLDAVLEPTKDDVLRMKEQLDEAGITNQDRALRQASGEAFYNTSPFRLRDLRAIGRANSSCALDFEAYLDGFSPNVQEILERFKFRNEVPTLVGDDILGFLLEKFLDSSINLSPQAGSERGRQRAAARAGQPQHGDGLRGADPALQRGEQRGGGRAFYTAGRGGADGAPDFRGRSPTRCESTTYLVYDGACGTGGMLTVAEETLGQPGARDQGKEVSIHLYRAGGEPGDVRDQQGGPDPEGGGGRGGQYPVRLDAVGGRVPRRASLTSCFRTRPMARAGKATWSAWAAKRVLSIPASWLRTTATLTFRW